MSCLEYYDELNPFIVRPYDNEWHVQVIFKSLPSNRIGLILRPMLLHTIINTKDDEKLALEIAKNCNDAVQIAFKKGYDAGCKNGECAAP